MKVVIHLQTWIGCSNNRSRLCDTTFRNDFILSNSMSFGRPYIMKTTGYIHDGWLLLRKKMNNIDNNYIYSILGLSLIYKLFKKATIGGVVDNLNINLVKKIKIPVPPLEIQNEIANHVEQIINQAEKLQAEASLALAEAKVEVESMILGEK